MMKHDFFTYCQKLYNIDKAFDQTQSNRLLQYRHLEPQSAQFLASLVIATKANEILEIGTSTGYSTLWFAYGLRNNPTAQLISIDIDHQRIETAQQHLENVGLLSIVQLYAMDAKDFLRDSQIMFDIIFLDAERQFYLDYVDDLHKVLTIGSVLIVDNVISHANEVADFLSVFMQDSRYLCTTLPIGTGLFLAVKQAHS